MKYDKFVIISFLILDVMMLLFSNYIGYTQEQTASVENYHLLPNQQNIVIMDNIYSNQIANEIIKEQPVDDIINFINYTADTTEWYYSGPTYEKVNYLNSGRFFNNEELTGDSNSIIVSEQVYFENGKDKEITLANTTYNIVGVLNRNFSLINNVDYIFPAYNFINSDDKSSYQLININSKNQIDTLSVVNIITAIDPDISFSTDYSSIQSTPNFEFQMKQLKLIKDNSIYLTLLIIIITSFFYIREKKVSYRVYQLFGMSEFDLSRKILYDFFGILLIPVLISGIIYYLLCLANGFLFYSDILFLGLYLGNFLKLLLFHVIVATCIVIGIMFFLQVINIKNDLR